MRVAVSYPRAPLCMIVVAFRVCAGLAGSTVGAQGMEVMGL